MVSPTLATPMDAYEELAPVAGYRTALRRHPAIERPSWWARPAWHTVIDFLAGFRDGLLRGARAVIESLIDLCRCAMPALLGAPRRGSSGSPYRIPPPVPAQPPSPGLVARVRALGQGWRRRRAWSRWRAASDELDRAFWAWHRSGFASRELFAAYGAALDREQEARRLAWCAPAVGAHPDK